MILKLSSLIRNANWIKTDFIKPHEYVVEETDPELVEAIKKKLVQNGYYEKFMGEEYRYIDIGDYKYWYIEPVLNRTKRMGCDRS